MTWLATTPGPDLPVPEGLARLRPPVVGTGSVTIADTGEPLVAVGPALPTLPVYASMPLEHRPREQRLRASVLQALIPADIALPDPWRLCLIDCWRPVAFQEALLEHYGAVMGDTAEFVARTDGPVPPPHTTGGAVDLTLAFDGVPLSLGTDFDAFTPDAAPAAFEDPVTGESAHQGAAARAAVRDARRLLAHVLGGQGFVVHPLEWWHWELGTHYWAQVTGAATAVYDLVED